MTLDIAFVKMHGLGNDYVFVDATHDPRSWLVTDDLAELARAMSDRRRGVGSDGLIVAAAPTNVGRAHGAMIRMRMYNADGSAGEMCGNGVRCLARLAWDRLGVPRQETKVEVGVGGGRVVVAMPGEDVGGPGGVLIDMGPAVFGAAAVGLVSRHAAMLGGDGFRVGVASGEENVTLTLASMGNPHAVVFVEGEEAAAAFVREHGPVIERHPAFPGGINVHAAAVLTRDEVHMHTWERGSGITHACGTGACAVAAIGERLGLLGPRVRVCLPGGELTIDRADATGHVLMTGPTAYCFEGTFAVSPAIQTRVGERTPAAAKESGR